MINRAIISSKEINNNMMINISKMVIEEYLALIVGAISLIRKKNKEEEATTTAATTRVATTEAIKREAIEILDSTIRRETMKITHNIPRNIKNFQEYKFHNKEGIGMKILATNSKRHYIILFFNGMILYVIQSISKV